MQYVKYLWLYCKNRNLLIKDKYFNDVINNNLITIKPAYSHSSCWKTLTVDQAKHYLEGMRDALIAITMKNL